MQSDQLEPRLYRVIEVAALLAIGESKVRRLIRDGKLRAVKVDGATRVPRESLEQYLASLPSVVDDEVEAPAEQAALVP